MSDQDLREIISVSTTCPYQPSCETRRRTLYFVDPLYRSSPIYLELLRRAGPFCGTAPKDGYHLESINLILRPVQHNTSGRDRALNVKLVAFSDADSPAGISGGVSTRKPLEMSGSPEAFDLLKRWLSGCVEEHDSCRKTLSEEELLEVPTLPARIIDVSPSDQPEIPRLVQTAGRMTGHWVALSHRWGKPEYAPINTTRATLDDRLRGIPLESMPKTFIDAVVITKDIGLRYLWIDSLCIIQDSIDDWKEQCLTMGLIYERAYLTVAASHAYDSRFGCFYRRTYPANLIQAVGLPFFVPTMTQTGTTMLIQDSGSFSVNIAWRPFSMEDPSSCTLGDRGWITQEWILSRRMVHYLKECMVWTCKTRAEDESGEEVTFWDRSSSWSDIVSQHSERVLTKEGDRLISLEGLATETRNSRMDGRYFFGLWRSDLPLQLLWSPPYFSFLQRNPDLPGVPSWSWASRKGSIMFNTGPPDAVDNPPVSRYCQIIDIVEEDTMLLIVSRLKALDKVSIRSDAIADISENVRGIVQRVGADTLLTVSGKEIGWVLFDEYCDGPHLKTDTFFCPLVRGRDEDGRNWCKGLLLQHSTPAMDYFERVGVAKVTEMAWLNNVEKQLVCIV